MRRQQLGLRKKDEDEQKAPTNAKGRGKGRGKGKKVEKKQTAVDQEDTEKDEGKVTGQDENEGEGKDDSKTKADQGNDPNKKGDGVNTDTKEVKKKKQGSWCPKLPKQKRTPSQKEPTGASQDAPGKETPGTEVAQSGSQAEKMPTGKNSGGSGKKKDKDRKPKTPTKKNEKEHESHEMKGTRGKKRETEESKSAEDLEVVEKGAADPKGAGACEKPAPTKRVRTKQPQNTETPASKGVENSGDGMGDAKPKKAPASKKTKKTKQKKPRCTALSRPDLWKTHGYESDPIEDSEEEERSEKEEVEGSAKEDAKVEVPRRRAAQAKAKTSKPQQANPGDDKPKKKKKKNPRKEGSPEEEEAPPKRRRQRSSSPACFARRKCPSSEFGKAKWHALKRAFTELIRPRLTTYSAHEDTHRNYDSLLYRKYITSHCGQTENSKYMRIVVIFGENLETPAPQKGFSHFPKTW